MSVWVGARGHGAGAQGKRGSSGQLGGLARPGCAVAILVTAGRKALPRAAPLDPAPPRMGPDARLARA